MSWERTEEEETLSRSFCEWRFGSIYFRCREFGRYLSCVYYLPSGMQVTIRSPHSPRVAYYRRLPIGSPTRAAIEKYLFSPEEPLGTTEALEVYRYLRDFSGASVTGLSLRELNRDHLDTIVEACLDAGADPF